MPIPQSNIIFNINVDVFKFKSNIYIISLKQKIKQWIRPNIRLERIGECNIITRREKIHVFQC